MKSPSKRQHQAEAETKKKQKSTDTKGKGRAVEIDLDDSDDGGATRANKRRTTGSQLKAGWKLQPLSLQPLEGNTLPARVSSRKSSTRRPSQSPVKRSASKQTTTSSSSKQQRTTPAAVTIPPISTSTAIEILSDDDEDDEIQEITSLAVAAEGPRASTSSSKSKPLRVPSPVRAPQLASTLKATITLDTPSQESDVTATLPITTTTTPSLDSVAVVGNDIDLEEDLEFLYPSTSRDALRQHGEQRAVITFDDDDIVGEDEGEVWEDNERMTMRRSDSEAGSMLDEPYYDFENGINEDAGSRAPSNAGDFAEMLDGQDPDSDDDILQLMDGTDSAAAGPSEQRSLPDVGKSNFKGMLRPLSSLSQSASTSRITLDSRPNAFTALMQGNNIDKKWADAAESEKAVARRGYIRPAPFYKVLEGMKIAVDAFKYGKIPGVEAYFLSHAHSDHYTNLSSSWANGPIYCSIGTANLIKYKLGVKDEWLHPLPFNETFDIAGTKVTLIDANHCPGSSIFVFEGPHTMPGSPYFNTPQKTFRYLHCGDFRASPAHLLHPALKDKRVDICYLDTTYLNPKYCFPAQEQVVAACSELVRCRVEGDRNALMKGSGGGAMLVRQGEMMKGWLNTAKKEEDEEALNDEKLMQLDEGDLLPEEMDEGVVGTSKGGKTEEVAQSGGLVLPDSKKILKREGNGKERLLVMVGTYSIGKERIVKGIARAINAKIYCDKRKREIFACQDDPELMSMLTDDPYEGQIHVTWLGQIKVDLLSDYLDQYKPYYTNIIGLRPTGWTFRPEGNLATTLKSPSVIQMLSNELKRQYNPSWMTPTKDSTRTVEAYGVPYSEHSSFAELTCFAVSLDCIRFIPTVNVGSKTSRDKMSAWFSKWAAERKRRKEAGEPLMVPHRTLQYW